MSGNWFKDHHRVLVYLPGSGGEFITALLNGQDMESSGTMTGNNRYRSYNSFPGHESLINLSKTLPESKDEWVDECRIKFETEMKLKEYLENSDLVDWKNQGNPDLGPGPIIRTIDDYTEEFAPDNTWFPTHYDYGLFREPVWKWLDYDNDYWPVHWSIMLFLKTSAYRQDGSTMTLEEKSHEFNPKNPGNTWHSEMDSYRKLYSRFPNSRISIDDKFDREFNIKTQYIDWAKRNLKSLDKYLETKNARDKFNDECYDYLNDQLPK